MRTILYGICGIGSGHTYRQLPIIDHFAKKDRIMVFAYGESLAFYKRHFSRRKNVAVEEVDVPFYVGDATGIDFAATARRHAEARRDHLATNCAALDKARRFVGTPDLVLSDYEPVAAQYAYAYGAPLVTIDQQSKYLCGDFPEVLGGLHYRDEIVRLRMFFPCAEARLACSFFRVPNKPDPEAEVVLAPPILKESVLALRPRPSRQPSVLLYLSAQQAFGQTPAELAAICARHPGVRFHVFFQGEAPRPGVEGEKNVTFYRHGDPAFHGVLRACHGIVATAGHTLLSEAMHLGIPVYALPLPLYEQVMNAHIIDANGFGIAHPSFDGDRLSGFLARLPEYRQAIESDSGRVLLRENGRERVIDFLEKNFLA